jgi:hypothetical protein
MTISTTIQTFAATAAVALTLTSSALAAGEPKNELPFTRPVGAQHPATLTASYRHTTHSLAQVGEPKNQLPFTRR